MKTTTIPSGLRLVALGSMLALAACTTTPPPAVSPEGLVLQKGAQADLLYVRPGTDVRGYTKVALLEPHIAFRSGWQSDHNMSQPMNRITDKDMATMIATGKKLLIEELTKELQKGGYAIVTDGGADVLAVKAGIINLDVFAPDPNAMGDIWSKTYTDGAGEATLVVELYDSVSAQLLVRAYDHQSNANNGFSWRTSRTQTANIQDARNALNAWAEMLVQGLNRAKAAPAPATH